VVGVLSALLRREESRSSFEFLSLQVDMSMFNFLGVVFTVNKAEPWTGGELWSNKCEDVLHFPVNWAMLEWFGWNNVTLC
jgi:hypothetical protein